MFLEFWANEDIVSKKSRRKRGISDEMTEQALESIVFGKDSDILDKISKKCKNTELSEKIGFFEDRAPEEVNRVVIDSDSEESDESDNDISYTKSDFLSRRTTDEEVLSNETTTEKKSVWIDSDDYIQVSDAMKECRKLPKRVTNDDKYKDYLENKFNDLYKKPKWAQMDDKDDSQDSSGSDSDEDVNRTAQAFKARTRRIDRGVLAIKKCTHLTNDHKMKSSLNCVEFHPTSTVGMVSSPNGSVHLFQVDGKINARIQSIQFKDFKIETAKFNKSGEELIVGSKRESGFYFYYDMISGKIVKIPFVRGNQKYSLEKFVLSNDHKLIASKGNNGFVNILTAKTKEHIFDLKMNGEVMSLAFSDDSNVLLSHGNGGKVYVWDVRNRQCMNRFVDEGCVSGTAIALSHDSKFCCTGSDMGVVNVYNYNDVLTQSEPKPLKTIMNLTTEISQLKFNHSSELLLMSSKDKDNSIKCVHMKTLTVYPNFPFAAKNYGRINDSDISLNSGYMTLATNGGTAHLFRLTDFGDY
ncbi:unnamed protein product [Medioppia subpectinata]|uniref:U3 small nucleolar RNA-associated protein 18-like protein n=1 Tax=Medioppia subpectinata TaxID=1979941 RepID=A0A7R9PXM6_9ACAR|nr:unnamed protein product [Medioppia subpectinata]CAG2104539.1 unnamed protein product [Medioppia subpectinata]